MSIYWALPRCGRFSWVAVTSRHIIHAAICNIQLLRSEIMHRTAIGLLFRMLPETAVFTVAYIPLRSFAGGYHAKTPFRCWVISNFLLIAALLIVRYVSHFTAFFLLLTALSLLCLVVLMPVSDIHKKLSEKDRKKYRRKGLMILMVELCASAMLYYFALINFSYSIFSAWILLSIMLIGGMIKNGVQAKK